MSEQSTETSTSGWRKTTSTLLLVLVFFAAAAANFSIWIQTTISRTDDFVETFEPLPEDESVAQLLGQAIANATIDPEQAAADISARLPDELQPLAVPAATALNGLAANTATRLIESDVSGAVWERTLRAAHTALIQLLDLRNNVQVLVVNVEDAANQVSERLEAIGITITVPEAPTVPLVTAAQNSVTVNALRFIYSTGWVIPAAFVVLVAAVVLVGPDRRRAVSFIGLTAAAAMVFDLVVMRILRTEFGEQGGSGVAVNAIHSAWDIVTTRLKWQTWLVLLVAVIVWGVARYVGAGAEAPSGRFPSPATVAFLDRWGTSVRAAAVVLGLALMIFAPTMTFGLALLIALIVAGILVLISWAESQPSEATAAPANVDD